MCRLPMECDFGVPQQKPSVGTYSIIGILEIGTSVYCLPMLLLLDLLRLIIRFEARTITTIVLPAEHETSFERSHRKCAEDEKWK